ncbi:chromosomal replication initiator protein DnaA [Alphaproteobacteria bacterium]|nr:chromosomal replication initiator protein DnaA [Alphaproteobacteria bacterium]
MSEIVTEKILQIWKEILCDLRTAIGEQSFKNWVSKLKILSAEGSVLKLMAPSNFVRDTVFSRFSEDILTIANSYGCNVKSINISVCQASISDDIEIPDSIQKKEETDSFADVSVLDKRFVFRNFVVGKPNEFAYAAAIRVAESETTPFNPLFLYGGVGLGKTHLMHAIAWRIKELYPIKKVIYLSAEKFMYLFIKSLRFKTSISFKEMFRAVDVLMVDDVQFIGGKDTTQEEFFHTFNELVDNNRQVILSADKSPSDLAGVEDRLKSRLGWGLVADIHPTTYELRLGILQVKAKTYKVPVPENVLEFLAVKISSNIRELEGALNRVMAHAILIGRKITIDVAQDVLKDLLRSNEKSITIEGIQKKVCEYYGVKLSDLNSAKRHQNITNARHIAMYLSKQLTTKSLPEIGRNFNGKDHATVIYAVKRVIALADTDSKFRSDLEVLTKSMES